MNVRCLYPMSRFTQKLHTDPNIGMSGIGTEDWRKAFYGILLFSVASQGKCCGSTRGTMEVMPSIFFQKM
jgi:hypothetical protein